MFRLTTARAAVVVLIACALLTGLYFARKSGTNSEVYGNDFSVYYHAAGEVIAGRDPYQRPLGEWTPYIYPPLLAELMFPLALLPMPVAAYIWFLISAGFIVCAAWMLAGLASGAHAYGSTALEKTAGLRRWWQIAIPACAVIVLLRFILDTFNLGQVNGIVTGLAIAHVWLYARGNRKLSALALVIAVSIKLTPALLIFYHIAKLRVKFAVVCVALLGAVTAVSFLPFGVDSVDAFRGFADRTLKNQQGYNLAYAGNQSVRGAVARLQEGPTPPPPSSEASRKPAEPVTIMISFVLLAIAVFTAVRAQNEIAAAAPFFCCMVLLSPLSWKAHYVILLLPVAHLVSRMRTSGKAWYMPAAALAVSFAVFNLTSPRLVGIAAAEWADAHSLVLAGALIIFVACVVGAQEKVISLSPADGDSA